MSAEYEPGTFSALELEAHVARHVSGRVVADHRLPADADERTPVLVECVIGDSVDRFGDQPPPAMLPPDPESDHS
jgi:hypothetical protein